VKGGLLVLQEMMALLVSSDLKDLLAYQEVLE
jgi:hypothetical protein